MTTGDVNGGVSREGRYDDMMTMTTKAAPNMIKDHDNDDNGSGVPSKASYARLGGGSSLLKSFKSALSGKKLHKKLFKIS